MKKKLFSMFLALAMIVSVFPVGGFAAEAREEEKTPAFDDAVYLKESKNKMWVNIDDPNIVSSKTVSLDREIEIICRVDNFKKVYKPYREPEEILMNDFECSAEEAAQIMNGTSDDARVKYISTGLDFANYSISLEGPEIFVLQNDIVLTNLQYVAAGRPLTILAAKPYVVSMELAEGATLRPKQINAGICFGNFEEGGPIGSGAKITFSNVILDGKNKFIPLGIIASSVNDPVSLETPVLVEGACVINGKTSAATAAIESYGSVSYLGCTTVSNSTGIYGLFTGDVIVKDCNFYGLNTQREAFSAGGIGDATTFEVSNSFFVGGLGMGYIDPTSGKRGIDSLTIENCVMNRNSTLIAADISVKDSLVRWQDFSRFVPKGYWYWEYHYGKKHPGFLEIGGYSFASVDNVTFNSSSLLVYADSNPVKLGNADITNCDFVWNLPISEEERNEEGRGNLPAGITVFTFATSDHTITVDNADISGFIRGVSFWSHVTVKNSNIHGNEYGLWDASEYKSGIENSAKVSNSQIHDNLIAGICANSAEIFVSDSTIADNGSMDQANSGGLVFNLSEEPEGWDEFDEEYSGDYNVPRGIDVKNSTFKGNVSSADGGAIRIEDSSISVSVTGTEFRDNTAAGAGGAISVPDYSKLQVDATTEFRKNRASMAYSAPENASELYPNIKFARTSLSDHPLNNYDISYIGESRLNTITSVIPPEGLTVSWDNLSLEEIQSQLEEGKSQVKVTLDDGRKDDVSVVWDAINSELAGAKSGVYTLYGVLDITGKDFENPGEYPASITVIVTAPIKSVKPVNKTVPHKTSLTGLEALLLQEFPVVIAHLEDGTEKSLPISSWNLDGLSEDYSCGEHELTGDIDLSGEEAISNSEYSAELKLKVVPRVVSVEPQKPVKVKLGTTEEELLAKLTEKHPHATVVLSEGENEKLPVVWDVAGSEYYGGWLGTYSVYGDLTVNTEEIRNPDAVRPEIEVEVIETDPREIVSIEELLFPAKQNFLLEQPGREPVKEHASGTTPSYESLPENVEVTFADGNKEDLPVASWVKVSDAPLQYEGELDLTEHNDVEATELKAKLAVQKIPTDYEVWSIDSEEIFLEVYPGTTIEQLNTLLKEKGLSEIDVSCCYQQDDPEVEATEAFAYLFCDITLLDDEANSGYQKDVPGEYDLIAKLPSNFYVVNENGNAVVATTTVNVTVLEPLEIVSVKPAKVDAYQSFAFENIPNIPTQVTAVLEDGQEIPIDVEWKPENYAKDVVAEQTVLGELRNIPNMAKLPEDKDIAPPLLVNVIPVSYEITRVVSEEEWLLVDGGLTLAEITERYQPKKTVEISSVTEEIEAVTEYEVDLILDDAANPDYDGETIAFYEVTATLDLPDNITYVNPEGSSFDLVTVVPQAVDIDVDEDENGNIVLEAEAISAIEGTPFAELDLPETVLVPLTNGKTVPVPVNWGTGEGYDPSPEGLTEDNPIECEIMGELTDYPDYINGAGVLVKLKITVTMPLIYTIESISPSRFPETGFMDVNLGTSLEGICGMLESTTVQVAAKSRSGKQITVPLTFSLRQGENPDYDPMTVGEYTLIGYLPLDDNFVNSQNIQVQVMVKTNKYKISNVTPVRVPGVISGTPFAEVPLPETVAVTRSDKKTDSVAATWIEGNYNPTKIGNQTVKGTLVTPLPAHLENPNNRQPMAMVTVVNPTAKIIEMEQVFEEQSSSKLRMRKREEIVPGYAEYKYRVKLQHEDGTVTEEIISLYKSIG